MFSCTLSLGGISVHENRFLRAPLDPATDSDDSTIQVSVIHSE